MNNKILKLTPFVVEKIWGGKKIAKWKGWPDSLIGETWEISTHPEGVSRLGEFSLRDFIELNYLVKFIDTTQHLSIQVHPDDEYALKHENQKGKTECWLVLESEKGSGIYLGLKKDVTKKEFRTAVSNNVSVQNFLNFIPVKRGDFFVVPAGTIHAIGKGVSLIEVQQSSGVTYRVWDWGRVDEKGKSRELHVEKSFDVINFSQNFEKDILKSYREDLLNERETTLLFKHKDFKAELIYFSPHREHIMHLKKGTGITVLSGHLECTGINLKKYESYIIVETDVFSFSLEEEAYILVVE